jgi:hypothetical protein
MKNLLSILFLLGIFQLKAQTVKINYKESNEDFTNPERGFYIPSGTKASNFHLLNEAMLKTFRSQPQQLKNACYKINVSLIYRAYELDIFKDKPLSDDFLLNLQKDFDAVRAAGLKMVLRFAYINETHGGDCKDEYKICPPYGDAPKQIVFNHIKQLKPLFQKNADVIAVLQEGFIGIWGENYFTDYFGCATDSGDGRVFDSSWADRNQLLNYLLDAMPLDRMIQVRTPQIKQRYVYGPRATVNAAPTSPAHAYSTMDNARIGFHNDCFLASADDYGTFYDYGNSVSKRDTANFRLRKYFESDSRYVAVGGETCDDAYSPQNDCAPSGIAEKEMAAMHYSYLNAAYNNEVNNDWDSMGCMKNIKLKLGYRFVLKSAVLPKRSGKSFFVLLKLENKGYASPFNPRPVQLVLRNKADGKVLKLNFNTSIQKWFSGKIVLKQNFVLPAGIAKGIYQLLLNFPDGYERLQNDPAYSIRLANKDTWETATGFNDLMHVLIVE